MKKYKTVDEFLKDLPADRKEQVTMLRSIIMATNTNLTEHIKWNSPSYVLDGEDRITFNMHYPDKTMVLLHMGARRKENKGTEPIMKDATGLITWNSDIRGTLTFSSIEDIQNKQDKVDGLLKTWLSIL